MLPLTLAEIAAACDGRLEGGDPRTVVGAVRTDSRRLTGVLAGMAASGRRILFPIHPRTAKMLRLHALELPSNVVASEPVSYLEMLDLTRNAAAVLTDSGGLQKEASLLGTPCVTARRCTEWPETIESGWNVLADVSSEAIASALSHPRAGRSDPTPFFGDGHAAEKVAEILARM